MKALLPLGSIVLAKGDTAQKKLMIAARRVYTETEGKGHIEDYLCYLWPEGYMGLEHAYLLAHENIEKVVHQGFSNSEDVDQLLQLNKLTIKDFQ